MHVDEPVFDDGHKEGLWAVVLAVDADAEVQVGAGGVAGGCAEHDELARCHWSLDVTAWLSGRPWQSVYWMPRLSTGSRR